MAGDFLKIFLVVVITAMFLHQTGVINVTDWIPGQAPTPPGEKEKAFCGVTSGVTVTLDAYDKHNTGTAMSDSNYYKVENAGISQSKSVTDAGTFTASPFDTIEAWFQLRTSVGGKHYPSYKKEQLPCSPTHIMTSEVVPMGNITIKLKSDQTGDYMDIDGKELNNETLSAGEEVLWNGQVSMASETGRPNGGIVVLDFEKNNYSSSKFSISWNGVPLTTATTPTQHSSKSTNKNSLAWTYPAIYGPTPVSISISLAALSGSINPGCGARDCINDDAINMTFYDITHFENDAGVVGKYVEDPDTFSDIGDPTNDAVGFLVV